MSSWNQRTNKPGRTWCPLGPYREQINQDRVSSRTQRTNQPGRTGCPLEPREQINQVGQGVLQDLEIKYTSLQSYINHDLFDCQILIFVFLNSLFLILHLIFPYIHCKLIFFFHLLILISSLFSFLIISNLQCY